MTKNGDIVTTFAKEPQEYVTIQGRRGSIDSHQDLLANLHPIARGIILGERNDCVRRLLVLLVGIDSSVDDSPRARPDWKALVA